MNLDQLLTFQTVATTRSFTEASRRLLISQSAVSQQVQGLEATLKVRLFDRLGNKIRLTREGELLLGKTSIISTEVQDIKAMFDDLTNLESGQLDIGSSAVFGTYLLPQLLGHFNATHPGIQVALQAGNSHEITNRLLAGEIDFGFGGLFSDDGKIEHTLIHQERLVAVVGAHHPLANNDNITPEDLAATNLILREKGTRIRKDMDAWFNKFAPGFKPKKFIELENVEMAKKLLEQGIGLTMIPRIAVQGELNTGALRAVPLPDFDVHAYYYLYHLRNRRLSQAARAMLVMSLETLPLTHAANVDLKALFGKA